MALLLIGGAGFAYWRFGSTPKESPYLTVPVQPRQYSPSGVFHRAHCRQCHGQVGSQVSGTIDKLFADFNTKVNAGQVVAELNQDKFKAAVDQSAGQCARGASESGQSKVSVEDARSELWSEPANCASGELMAQSEFDAAQTAYDAARAQVNVNQAQVASSPSRHESSRSVDLNNTVIRSPVDGIVISRNVDVGQTVAASLSGADAVYHRQRSRQNGSAHQRRRGRRRQRSGRAGGHVYRGRLSGPAFSRQGAPGAQCAARSFKTS